MRVWLPYDDAVERLGGVPAGVKVDVYDGSGQRPRAVDEVEFYVPAYIGPADRLDVIADMRSLRVVQTLTAGVDDIRAFIPPGVRLCNARGVHDASTAELVVTLVLASLRGVPEFVRAQDEGRWASEHRPALADRTVLIVGYGSVGAAVERRLAGFECDVLRVARRARDSVAPMESLPDLLPAADVVVLLVPMTEQTRGMADAGFLARMKDGALLVNAARGPIVDTDALLAEVSAGRLRAALDVTDPEPLPADHPLWHAPGVLVSPHVGGNSTAMMPRAYRLLGDQLRRYVSGEPLRNVISGDY